MTEKRKKQPESRDAVSRLEARNQELIDQKGYRAGYDLARKSALIMIGEAVFIVLWLLMETVNGPLNTLPIQAFIIPILVGCMMAFEAVNLCACLKMAKKLKDEEDGRK